MWWHGRDQEYSRGGNLNIWFPKRSENWQKLLGMIFGVQPCVFYYKFIVWKVVEKKYLDLT